MIKRVLFILVLTFILVGFNQDNNIADGNVTEDESRIYQELWCDYNKDRDFAKEQCEEYWSI